jgi:sec-independent protein translocase protein TatC
MPLLEHLRELRTRLVVSLAALLVAVIGCFVFADPIFELLKMPMMAVLGEGAADTFVVLDPLETILTYLKVAVLAGLGLASPVIFHQGWLFVAPGLYDTERKVVIPLVIASTLLFLTGASFAYFVIFPYGFQFLMAMSPDDVEANISIAMYLATASRLLLAFGFCFQLPVVVFFLARIGLIDAHDMTSKFRYALVAIFVVAAMITPPDPMTQMLMAAPLTGLYGVSIIVARVFSTKNRQTDAEEEAAEDTGEDGFID